VACGVLYDRVGPRGVMTWTALLTAFGAVALALVPAPWLFLPALAAFQFGNGLGCCVNALVGRLYGPDRTRGLSILHGCQGLGRLLAPLLVLACLLLTGMWRSAFIVTFVLMLGWAGLFRFGLADLPEDVARPGLSDPPVRPRRGLDWRLILGLSGFVFAAGTEATFVLWTPDYLEREAGLPTSQALTALTFTMGGFTAVRLGLGLIRRRMGKAYILTTAAVVVASVLLLRRTEAPAAIYVLCGLAGAAFSAFWTLLAALVYDRYPARHGTISGWMIVATTIGISGSAALAGTIGDLASLRSALLVSPAAAAIFAAVYCLFDRLSGKSEQEQPMNPAQCPMSEA
jgi:MFS family permease